MTRILIISRYYPPEKAAAAVCVSQIANRLAALGHTVTILTTIPNYPTGVVPLDYRDHLVQEERLHRVRIVRIWSYTSPNTGFIRRILSQLSFALLAPILGARAAQQTDLLIVASPPLFNVIPARLLARGRPLVFWVADLWPESAIQLGALRNRALIRLAQWLESSTYQRAQLVWVVTEGMRKILLQRGLAEKKLFLLPNGVDTAHFAPQPQAQARAALRWDNRFTVLYAGTHGLSHGLQTLLDAAHLLRKQPDIHFILVGDGAEKQHLLLRARALALENITFLDPLPHEQIPQLLAAADICLAHTRKLPLFEGMLPIKMYEAMSCARPLILALNGEARQLAEQAEAALVIEPEQPAALVSAILTLYTDRAKAAQLGEHGRAYVQAHFDYDLLTLRLAETLQQLL